ncbi:hypothetical protein XELAEV_18026964mg [Xenopus laevis]|uniref:Uncharacterized protein n=1 Tax=Xenopus laevis TaxID=8355 RepID=A0A974HJI5_XENLA|nr:hypothetical protein XELAEV_18026964mg [Xenopus laevis]
MAAVNSAEEDLEGGGLMFPSHTGLSAGMPTDPKYVLMEIHYDNPSQQQGLTGNSGIRVHYTHHVRKYDGGVLETGIWVSLYHMIPPGMAEFTSEGHCSIECLQKNIFHACVAPELSLLLNVAHGLKRLGISALSSENPEGIHVFAVLLHSHLAGKAIWARHYRKGEELNCLQHRVSGVLIGGLSTRDEMCLSFLLCYPKINLARCESIPEIQQQLQFIGKFISTSAEHSKALPVLAIKPPLTRYDATVLSTEPERRGDIGAATSGGSRITLLIRAQRKLLQIPINVRCSKHESNKWMVVTNFS